MRHPWIPDAKSAAQGTHIRMLKDRFTDRDMAFVFHDRTGGCFLPIPVIGVASAFEPWRSLERLWLARTSDAFWHHLLMGRASKSLICLGLMGLTFATASCGKGTEGKMGFFEWYMRGFRKGKVEQSARDAENAKDAERNARFWAWAKSPEGKKSIAGRTKITLEAKAGYPDTIYEMSPGSAFKISSRSAGITLSGEIDGRDGFAVARLRRSDGSYRLWQQGMAAETLGDLGDHFDHDDHLAAALLKSNPRPGWPGRVVTRERRDAQTIAKNLWEERTGEKLRFY